MTPKAPKATDSGLSASSTWATTREVALNRKAEPRPAGVDKVLFKGGHIPPAAVEL